MTPHRLFTAAADVSLAVEGLTPAEIDEVFAAVKAASTVPGRDGETDGTQTKTYIGYVYPTPHGPSLKKISAIKKVRELADLSLVESKDVIEDGFDFKFETDNIDVVHKAFNDCGYSLCATEQSAAHVTIVR